jgi:hypothetical protein
MEVVTQSRPGSCVLTFVVKAMFDFAASQSLPRSPSRTDSRVISGAEKNEIISSEFVA